MGYHPQQQQIHPPTTIHTPYPTPPTMPTPTAPDRPASPALLRSGEHAHIAAGVHAHFANKLAKQDGAIAKPATPNGNTPPHATRTAAPTPGAEYHFGTRLIHSGSEASSETGAVIPAISLSTTYKQSAVGVHKVGTSGLEWEDWETRDAASSHGVTRAMTDGAKSKRDRATWMYTQR